MFQENIIWSTGCGLPAPVEEEKEKQGARNDPWVFGLVSVLRFES